jgi:hypothetical protein
MLSNDVFGIMNVCAILDGDAWFGECRRSVVFYDPNHPLNPFVSTDLTLPGDS